MNIDQSDICPVFCTLEAKSDDQDYILTNISQQNIS